METLYFRTLVEIVRTGSFSRAAANLCVSQSAVSRRVKFMEDQYGLPLLDRSGPVVTATGPGALVIEKSREILEIERALVSTLAAVSQKRSVRFACTTTFGHCHLPRILASYMARSPDTSDLTLQYDTPERIVRGLEAGSIDVGVIEHCSSFALPELPAFALPPDDMLFVSHPGADLPAEIAHVEDLFPQTLFVREEGCCSRTLLESNMRRRGRSLTDFRKVVVMGDLRLMAASVAAGEGIAFTSTELVSAETAAGTLRMHRVVGFEHARRRTLVLSGRARNRDVDDFSSVVRAMFGSPARDDPPEDPQVEPYALGAA